MKRYVIRGPKNNLVFTCVIQWIMTRDQLIGIFLVIAYTAFHVNPLNSSKCPFFWIILAVRIYAIILDTFVNWFILFGINVLFLFKEMVLLISRYDNPNSSMVKVISNPEDGIFNSCLMSTSSKEISTPNRSHRYQLKFLIWHKIGKLGVDNTYHRQ